MPSTDSRFQSTIEQVRSDVYSVSVNSTPHGAASAPSATASKLPPSGDTSTVAQAKRLGDRVGEAEHVCARPVVGHAVDRPGGRRLLEARAEGGVGARPGAAGVEQAEQRHRRGAAVVDGGQVPAQRLDRHGRRDADHATGDDHRRRRRPLAERRDLDRRRVDGRRVGDGRVGDGCVRRRGRLLLRAVATGRREQRHHDGGRHEPSRTTRTTPNVGRRRSAGGRDRRSTVRSNRQRTVRRYANS